MKTKLNLQKTLISGRCPVADSFAAAACTYDLQPGIQAQVARELAARLEAQGARFDSILEVGCGTGFLTGELCRLFPSARIVAVDVAPTMLAQVRRRLPKQANLETRQADVRELDLPKKFALITSSSALHWMTPLPATFARLRRFLQPGGRMVFAMMLQGTLAELHELRAELTPRKALRRALPSAVAVLEALREAGWEREAWTCEKIAVTYASASALLQAIQAQGVTGGFGASGTLLTRGEMRRLLAEYEQRHAVDDGGVVASYQVLYGSVRAGGNHETHETHEKGE